MKNEGEIMEQHARKKSTYWKAGIIAALFLGLFAFISIRYIHQARKANDELIAQHIEKLHSIFKDINATCKINGFRHTKHYIDFLNVGCFEGSIVGPMSLLEPKNWKGPYLKESLTIGGKEYEILSTKSGFYIIPGDGVTLANGKVIGKTLVINESSDIEALMRDPKALLSNGKPLAARIEIFENPALALERGETKADVEPLE